MADKFIEPIFTNVSGWCYTKDKESKKDPGLPMRPDNIRTDEETEMPAAKVAIVLQGLVNKVNLLIDDIEEMWDIIETLPDDVQAQIDEHASKMSPTPGGHMQGSSTPPPGGRRGGKLQSGGTTDGRLSPAERTRLIDKILNNG
jgi:hypothetical protein